MAARGDEADQENVFFFIDNSNIFIEGKKAYARMLKLRTIEEPCFRIDIGRLMKTLLKGRNMAYGKLYGSEPPALDTVWKAIRDEGLEVGKFRRSMKGKEKEIDNALAVEAVAYAFRNKHKRSTSTVVLLAGDRDYTTLVRMLLDENWRVEVASFSKALAGSIRSITENKENLKIFEIDKLLVSHPSCYFINRKWSTCHTDESRRRYPRHLAVAFHFKREFDLKSREDKILLREFANALTEIVRFPCRYDFKENSKNTIFIIFKRPSNLEPSFKYQYLNKSQINDKCKIIFQQNNELCQFEPYVDYLQKKKEASDWGPTQTSRWFSEDDENEDRSTDEEYVDLTEEFAQLEQGASSFSSGTFEASGLQQTDPSIPESIETSGSDAGEFQFVENKRKNFSRITSSEFCSRGFNCRLRTRCNKRHKKEEMDYFRYDSDTVVGTKYKSKPCFSYRKANCKTGNHKISPNCYYYHALQESRCYQCHIDGAIGHAATDCSGVF